MLDLELREVTECEGAWRVRHDAHPPLCRLCLNASEGRFGYPAVDLHAGGTLRGQGGHGAARGGWISHNASRWECVGTRVENAPAGEDARPGPLTGLDAAPVGIEREIQDARVADTRDAVRQEEQSEELALADEQCGRVVDMEVDETGQHDAPVAGERRGVRRSTGPDLDDPAVLEAHGYVASALTSGLDQVDTSEHCARRRERKARRLESEPEPSGT
jgi:hypothetical protein